MICKYNSSVFICKKKKEKEKSIALAYLVGSLPGFKRSWDHGHSRGLKQEAWFGVTLGVSIYYNVFLSILLNIINIKHYFTSAVCCQLHTCVWGGKKRNRCDSEWQQFATSWLVFSNTFLHWNFVESCPNQVLSMYIRVHNFHKLFFDFFLTVLGKYNNLRYWRYWINNNQSLNKIDLKHFTLHAMNMEYMIM